MRRCYLNFFWNKATSVVYLYDKCHSIENNIYMKKGERSNQVKDFVYSEFRKIADKVPFTQAEWAAMLHVSERTLQRYAKNNGAFAPINAERALQIANVISEGKKTFGKTEMFYSWLKTKPVMAEGTLSLESLSSAQGIQQVLTQLGRIQHGILA